MVKTLVILRSVSGAGKSTFGNLLVKLAQLANLTKNNTNHAADDLFTDKEGNYNFKPEWLGAAHKECISSVEDSMCFEEPLIICSNTNTTKKELKPYLDLASKYNYQVFSLIVENRHGDTNVHNVPQKTLDRQEQNLRNSIKLQ